MAKELSFEFPPNGFVGLLVYDSVNDDWYAVLGDADGHIQLDVLESALPSGAATAILQGTMITALQSIQNLVGALGDVAVDELRVNLIGNEVKAGTRDLGIHKQIYNDVPGDTDWHEFLSVSGPGRLLSMDFVSNHKSSGVNLFIDGEYIHTPLASTPQIMTGCFPTQLNDSGGEGSWYKAGVYDDVNDYYSIFLKREVAYYSTLVGSYKAGSVTADVGVVAHYRATE